MFYFLSFIYGMIFGSFLNVCIYRMPLKKSLVKPGSACPSCNTYLKWYDNIPVLSYLFLNGKCRYCRTEISMRYAFVEMFSGLVMCLVFLVFGVSFEFIFISFILFTLIAVTFIDIDHKIIPNRLVIALFVIGAAYEILCRPVSLLDAGIGILAASVPMLLLAIISKGGMGGGDIKLMAAAGIFLGWQGVLLALFVGSIIGSIIGIFGIVTKKIGKRETIPFGPYLCMGIAISMFLGEWFINYYLTLFA